MKLSDVMGAADLAIYAEIGLVLFLAAFFAVVAKVLWPGGSDEYERAGRIPFSETPVIPRRAEIGEELSR